MTSQDEHDEDTEQGEDVDTELGPKENAPAREQQDAGLSGAYGAEDEEDRVGPGDRPEDG